MSSRAHHASRCVDLVSSERNRSTPTGGSSMPIDRDLVFASQVDLRRLSLLAALAAAGRRGTDVDPEPAAKGLEPFFRGLPGCLDGDIEALLAEELVILDDSIVARKGVMVTDNGRALVERLQQSAASDRDARTAVVAVMALYYMHVCEGQARLATTDALRRAGATLIGGPLPDGCVEEALKELHDLGFIDARRTWNGMVIPLSVTSEGRAVLRASRPVLIPEQGRGKMSSVFNTTINGEVRGQNIVVGSQGDIDQDATVITADQTIANLRVAVDALYVALAGQKDLQDKIEALLEKLDEAEDQGDRSLMARALSGLSRLAQRVAGKGVDHAVTLAVTKSAGLLMKALTS